jgi:diguanylate cyclase (GGDEF)-like protein
MAGSQSDISIRKAAETKLRRDAFFDRLTDLPNRAFFIDRLKNAISVANQRPDYIFAVFFLDMDQFKNINDRFGHPLGDQLLVEIGKRLRSMIRAADTVARLGGDEFVLLLEGIHKVDDVPPMAEYVLSQLSTPINMAGSDLFVSTSMGIVLSTQGYLYPEDILRDADIAMYAAKAQGKSTYRIFDPTMRDQIMERLTMEADLRQAIQKGQLFINYQPIISFTTRSLVGFEALARWNHPKKGLLPPKQFIPLAQDTGLILSIDRWILEQACLQIRQWQQRYPLVPPLKISVNMTSGSMAQKDLVNTIRQILEQTGLDTPSLKLEITENTIMQSDETVSATLEQLKEMGVDIQIDDFGTGYSSLAYLQQIPVSALKIDQTFIQQISRSDAQTEIIRTIVELSHLYGLQTIAEGVETQGQLDALLSIGCDLGQGFLLSYPLDQDKVASLLEIISANNHAAPPWQKLIPD